MKGWLTLAEIAELALPGLPETERGLRMLAEREDWRRHERLVRERAGRGGGVEYHVSLLPLAARVAYFCQRARKRDPGFSPNRDPVVVGLIASTRGGAAGEGCGVGARAGSAGRDFVRRDV